MYLNPFNDKMTISLGQIEKDEYTLRIYDSQGKVVYSISDVNSSNQEILLNDLTFLTPGIYIMKLQGERNSYCSQIIKK
nr:T9SS type A sorting domain-containing protein [uncultured Cytophaga sp.]